jgi:hypothetical protein
MAKYGFMGEEVGVTEADGMLDAFARLRATVDSWAYPASIIEAASEDANARGTLRRLREAVRENMHEGLDIGTRMAREGNLDGAADIFERATNRWFRWLDQVDHMNASRMARSSLVTAPENAEAWARTNILEPLQRAGTNVLGFGALALLLGLALSGGGRRR